MDTAAITATATATATAMASTPSRPRYLGPGWATRRILNPTVAALVRIGLPLKGAHILEVPGRVSGEWRATPVNPLTLDGARYLVAPRGETQWVRNLRAAGAGRLRSRAGTEHFFAVEVDDAAKPPLLRAYLERWASEAGKFFDGVGPDAADDELAAIAGGVPVFRIG